MSKQVLHLFSTRSSIGPLTVVLPCVLLLVSAASAVADTAIAYDSATGLLPQQLDARWVFVEQNNPPSTASVDGGILMLESAMSNRAHWMAALPGISPEPGIFMETTVRIASEEHAVRDGVPADRGVGLAAVLAADGTSSNSLDLYGWQDRIFVNDTTDTTVAECFMDTTDAFHTYRLELLGESFAVFVDGILRMMGTSPKSPNSAFGLQLDFCDGSAFSGSGTEWKSVTGGLLSADQAAGVAIIGAGTEVNLVPPASFTNPNMQNALTNKLDAALALIDQGAYAEALSKLANDVLAKTDGCALHGAPDKNDWIATCEGQHKVYPVVQQAIAYLQELLQ